MFAVNWLCEKERRWLALPSLTEIQLSLIVVSIKEDFWKLSFQKARMVVLLLIQHVTGVLCDYDWKRLSSLKFP